MYYSNITSLTIGVLLVNNGIQMTDVASVDVLTMVGKDYMTLLPNNPGANAIASLASPMSVVYITENGTTPIALTGGAEIDANYTIEDAPKLDILVVPGPALDYVPDEKVRSFIKSTNDDGGHILSVCTGILAVAPSGVLDGKNGTALLGIVPEMRELWPKVEWKDTRRWERNAAEGTKGQVWSSGSIANGIDQAAAFVREHWPAEIAEPMMYLASVPERPAEYSEEEKEWGDKWTAILS
ncbi:unnamed protein product [Peniophora sp. CBMAI 1063]|nr:unnamed protein product [Peniophora sp. CBMAI 1063]